MHSMYTYDSQVTLLSDDELCKRAKGGERANWVTDSELRNAGTHGFDDAGVIGARDEGQGGLFLVFA